MTYAAQHQVGFWYKVHIFGIITLAHINSVHAQALNFIYLVILYQARCA